MASRRTHDLVIKVGEYTDGQGQTKARTKNIGSVWAREDGSQFIALDATVVSMELQWVANPNHSDKVMVSVYEARERGEGGGQRQQQQGGGGYGRNQQQGGYGGQGGGHGAGSAPPAQNGGTGGHRDDLDDDIPF